MKIDDTSADCLLPYSVLSALEAWSPLGSSGQPCEESAPGICEEPEAESQRGPCPRPRQQQSLGLHTGHMLLAAGSPPARPVTSTPEGLPRPPGRLLLGASRGEGAVPGTLGTKAWALAPAPSFQISPKTPSERGSDLSRVPQ